jgi:hypothetical protein
MKPFLKSSCTIVMLFLFMSIGGCASLKVTSQLTVKPAVPVVPVTVGIQATGDRLREAVSDTDNPVTDKTTETLFYKVKLLPQEARLLQPSEILTSYGVDYLLAVNIGDISVNGNLNPIWFASIPLFFFKPYTPIVTFEAIVTLEATVRDTRTGTVVMHKEITETAMDHFSPMNPQEKVRKLVGRGINNAMILLLQEMQQEIAWQKQKS